MAIVAGDTLVSGEYSAENGSPTALGVTDSLCAGRALYGHGRGMCQWGSQRWALDGRDHRWIATHYYPGSSIAGGGPTLPAYDAELAGMDHPAELISGERAVVWVELRNTGATAWDLTGTWLGTTGPRDRASALYDTENWLSDHRATAPDHSGYATDTVGRFTFMVTAPAVTETATVTETFGLVQEGVDWFGPEDVTISIVVHPADGTAPPTEPTPPGGMTDEPSTPGEEPAPEPGGSTTEPDPPAGPSAPGTPPPAGDLSGGCSATGASSGTPLPFIALGMLALAVRRRRR
jgi:MYXO-CTERM domain-containing protein